MSVQCQSLLDYSKLYSAGNLPKLEGRYLSGPRINVKMGAKNSLRKPDHSQSTRVQHILELSRARARVNNEITKVKEERKLKALESRKFIASLSCKSQNNGQTPDKRIHTMEISQIFHSEQTKAKQLNSQVLRRRLRSTSKDYSQSKRQGGIINRSILKQIMKTEEPVFLVEQSEVNNATIEKEESQKQKKVETSAVSQLIAEKMDLLSYQISREEIKLSSPMLIQEKLLQKCPIPCTKSIDMKSRMIFKRHSFEVNGCNWESSTNCSQGVEEYPTIIALNASNSKTNSEIYEDLGSFSDEMGSTKRQQMRNDERIERWA